MWNDLYRLSSARTRSISAENPTGAKSAGAQAVPDEDSSCAPAARRLGKGWKVRPCLRDVAPGATVLLADVEGPGVVEHIWCTVEPEQLPALTVRVTYDDDSGPSIECPLGDFFANGLDGLASVQSMPVAVNPRGGMNSYWPLPFRRRVRVELTNRGEEAVPSVFYQITYALQDLPADTAYLRAAWHEATTRPEHPEHVILKRVEGRGHYVGTYLIWRQHQDLWWGEGEVKFFIDDDPLDAPTICGTGTEDYFGGAWGFGGDHPDDRGPRTYSGPLLGCPQANVDDAEGRTAAHAMYRWHLPDPVRFQKNLRVTIQALGWGADDTYVPLADEIRSLALWYQAGAR